MEGMAHAGEGWPARTGTTKPYGNSCFKLKIRRQRGAAYRQTIETMNARVGSVHCTLAACVEDHS